MHPVFLKIGPLEIRYYGMMYAIAFFLGLYLGKKEAKRRGIDFALIEDFAFTAMLSGLIGARLYYVFMNWSDYAKTPLEIIAVWHGGMAIHGGILGAIIGTLIFAAIRKVNPLMLGDIGAAPFILGQAIGRIGNFTNGDAHGVPTFTPIKVMLDNTFQKWYSEYLAGLHPNAPDIVPWGVIFPVGTPAGNEYPYTPTHPVMIYEMILNFIAFLLIWFVFRKKEKYKHSLFYIYIIAYSIIRSVVTIFRADDLMYFGVIRSPHLMSIIFILVASILLYINLKKYKSKLK